MEKLDLKDRKILYQLDLDARQSDSHIAKKVKLSRDAVKYRINKLLEKGFINYFMTVLNSMKLGFNWYRTFFKFQNLTVEKEEEIIGWLRDKASWITKVEGIWDLNTGIFVKDVYEYRDIINKILSALLKNARMKTIDIAKKINSTEMVVRYRIKKMMENGIIIGFRPFLNVHKLNYIYFKTHFTLHNLTPEKKKKIFDYIHVHPNTVHTTELVGGADLETEFQVTHNNEFNEYIKDIRLRFGDIIRDYEFMQYTQEYKFTYLPEIQFKV